MALAQVVHDRGRRTVSRDVGLQRFAADAVGHLGERLALLRHVEAYHLGAVARERLGDRLADAARRACDQRDLAVERLLPVGGRLHSAGADAHHLCVDVCGLGGQQEAQRRLHVLLRAGLDIYELHCRASAQLLAHRAGEALERPLRGVRTRAIGRRRRTAKHEQAPARPNRANGRVEEVVELAQLLRGRDPGGVEDERAVAKVLRERVVRLLPGRLERVANRRQKSAAAEKRRPLEQRLPRFVATQPLRLRQPELLRHEAAGRCLDQLLVAVCQVKAPRCLKVLYERVHQ